MKTLVVPTILAILWLSACTKSAGGGQHGTVEMRDGTSVSGTIVSSSAAEIQLAGDDKVTRTIPMAQVRSIEYDDAAAPATDSQPPAASNTAPPPGGAPAPTIPPPHRAHHHPTESAITTRTSELAPGTRISVRAEETIDSGKAVEGQTFPATVTQDVLDAAGNVVSYEYTPNVLPKYATSGTVAYTRAQVLPNHWFITQELHRYSGHYAIFGGGATANITYDLFKRFTDEQSAVTAMDAGDL